MVVDAQPFDCDDSLYFLHYDQLSRRLFNQWRSLRVKQINLIYFLASKTRLNGVSAARRNSEKPSDVTTSRSTSSEATAPNAGPPSASEFAVQQSVDAPEKHRPMMLKFSSTVFPAIGSTIMQLPPSASVSAACFAAPRGSPMSCRQSKKQIRS